MFVHDPILVHRKYIFTESANVQMAKAQMPILLAPCPREDEVKIILFIAVHFHRQNNIDYIESFIRIGVVVESDSFPRNIEAEPDRVDK